MLLDVLLFVGDHFLQGLAGELTNVGEVLLVLAVNAFVVEGLEHDIDQENVEHGVGDEQGRVVIASGGEHTCRVGKGKSLQSRVVEVFTIETRVQALLFLQEGSG